jgi:flavin reductase (DIM6/NTAB) family NADH-FMN oxidoreductase RutF
MASRRDPELFREVFGRFATGVAVITVAGPGGVGGMTATALCSLSLEPLLALVCFANDARTLNAVREAGGFAVNLLAADQHDVAAAFASKMPEAEKIALVDHRLVDGMPVIEGTLAWVVLELRELLDGGDHTIAIGEVVHMGLGAGEPLLWFEGRYRTLPAT